MGYPGGKSGSGVYQALINLMPPHQVYVEPFLGGGAVLRYKRPAAVNIGIDLDPDVIASWQAVRDRQSPEPAPAAVSARSGSFKFLVADGIAFLRSSGRSLAKEALVYCDPPYLHSTRVCTRHYRHEMSDRQHEELLDVLNSLSCRVMVSGYSSTMYARRLRGWNATAFQAGTRGKPAAEWVWYNFDRPVELHDYRFLGDSKRERERIRRKQRRWVNRLCIMPDLERQALLSAIAETAGNGDGRSTSTAPTFGDRVLGARAPVSAALEDLITA